MSFIFSIFIRKHCSLLGKINSTNVILERNLMLYTNYTNKKKRIIKYNKSEKNLEWAKQMLDMESEMEKIGTLHMLHLVTLKSSLKGRPWWEKDIISELQLDGKINTRVILKNTSGINKLLNEIKHLVLIQPLKLPSNFPSSPSSLFSNNDHIFVKSNGEMVFKPTQDNSTALVSSFQRNSQNKIFFFKTLKTNQTMKKPFDNSSEKQSNLKLNYKSNEWLLTKEAINKRLSRILELKRLNMEQFPTKYLYKHNQDGKMYRYNSREVRTFRW